jgi:hypothetical protein
MNVGKVLLRLNEEPQRIIRWLELDVCLLRFAFRMNKVFPFCVAGRSH